MDYSVRVSYDFVKHGLEFDDKLDAVVGTHNGSSGVGFVERDLAWHFKSRKDAISAFKKLTRMRSLTSLCLTRDE